MGSKAGSGLVVSIRMTLESSPADLSATLLRSAGCWPDLLNFRRTFFEDFSLCKRASWCSQGVFGLAVGYPVRTRAWPRANLNVEHKKVLQSNSEDLLKHLAIYKDDECNAEI